MTALTLIPDTDPVAMAAPAPDLSEEAARLQKAYAKHRAERRAMYPHRTREDIEAAAPEAPTVQAAHGPCPRCAGVGVVAYPTRDQAFEITCPVCGGKPTPNDIEAALAQRKLDGQP